jgi:hypothetical protein
MRSPSRNPAGLWWSRWWRRARELFAHRAPLIGPRCREAGARIAACAPSVRHGKHGIRRQVQQERLQFCALPFAAPTQRPIVSRTRHSARQRKMEGSMCERGWRMMVRRAAVVTASLSGKMVQATPPDGFSGTTLAQGRFWRNRRLQPLRSARHPRDKHGRGPMAVGKRRRCVGPVRTETTSGFRREPPAGTRTPVSLIVVTAGTVTAYMNGRSRCQTPCVHRGWGSSMKAGPCTHHPE